MAQVSGEKKCKLLSALQAGLGGARDATNVLRGTELAASIITTIGEEHLDALGGFLIVAGVRKRSSCKGKGFI